MLTVMENRRIVKKNIIFPEFLFIVVLSLL